MSRSGVAEELFVLFVEAFHGFFLMAEDFHHPLPLDHLFDVAVERPQRLLLAEEVASAAAADLGGDHQHTDENRHHHNGEQRRKVNHGGENGDHRQERTEHLGQTLGNELPQGIHIVGVVAHDFAVGVGIEIADGQRLHMGEEVFPQVAQNALGDHDHDAGIEEGRGHPGEIECTDDAKSLDELGKDRCIHGEERRDVIVDEDLDKHGRTDPGGNGDDHGNDDHDKVGCVAALENIAQEPFGRGRIGFFHFRAGRHFMRSGHRSHLLFSEKEPFRGKPRRFPSALRGGPWR